LTRKRSRRTIEAWEFAPVLERKAEEFLKKLPGKSRRIVIEKILDPRDDPYPGERRKNSITLILLRCTAFM